MVDRSLYHDGSPRCLRCLDIVRRVERSSYCTWTHKRYEPSSACSDCQLHLQSRRYFKLGDHLLSAHDDAEVRGKVLEQGCCYICLLCLQLKCRNGFKSINYQSAMGNRKGPVFPDAENTGEPRNIQFFSDSVDGLVDMARYLPQGRPVRNNTMAIIPLPGIHSGTLKSWLKFCEDNHDCEQLLTFSRAASTNPCQTFINVKSQSLVTCEADVRYIALSYVWGGISQLLLTGSNQEALCQDGSLLTFAKEIPQVIKDAMQVINNIGETFLWVDSLCIVQDDEASKHHLISQMGSIYNGASATIIAASGEDAAFGLPGVRANSRVLEHLGEIPGTGLHITNRRPLGTILDNSTYNTRGWTFQERLLSRRCFYFTETQVFFECCRCDFSEDREIKGHEESKPLKWTSSTNLITKLLSPLGVTLGNEQKFLRYSGLVEEYWHRKFTFANDVVNAFAGVAAAIEKLCDWTMVYGLPEQLLDWALLWEPEDGQYLTNGIRKYYPQRAEDMHSTPSHKKELRTLEIPSWSWLAWTGGLCYNQWMVSDLRVFHTPFELVHSSRPPIGDSTAQSRHKSVSKPSILGFSSESVPSSSFVLKHTTFQNREICWVLNSEGQIVGIIPGIESSFAADYTGDLMDIVLLSASQRAFYRFRYREETGHPSIFGGRYTRDEWSVLTVMFVRWDNRYARRIALGYIHQVAWAEAKPKVKPILLA